MAAQTPTIPSGASPQPKNAPNTTIGHLPDYGTAPGEPPAVAGPGPDVTSGLNATVPVPA